MSVLTSENANNTERKARSERERERETERKSVQSVNG